MSNILSESTNSFIKTYGRLKGRSLSKNQKLGLAMLREKYNLFLETKKKNLARSWVWEWATLVRVSKKKL